MLRLFRYKPYLHLRYSTATATPKRRRQSPPAVTDPTLTLYFLQKSCKLSPAAAAAAAQGVNLKSTKNPHAVLALLRDYGFSESNIARLISRRPNLLLASPTRTLKPKLDFYASIGLSMNDFADYFSTIYRPFLFSVRYRLVPNLHLLRILLPSEADLLVTIRRYPAIIHSDLQKIVPVKTKVLLDTGLTMENIFKLIALYPRCFEQSLNEFNSSLAAVKELGVNPTTATFVHVFAVISKVPKLVWESRMQNFESLGWSRDQILGAFIKHPYCMTQSEEKVKKTMEFFKEKLGWGPDKLSVSPMLISSNLEKKIAPRYRMFKLLDDKGLLKNGIISWHFLVSKKRFMNVYVHKYQESVPEILEALSINSLEMDRN